jgi:hypothetical protein
MTSVPRRKALKAVAHNFLGTFASRNSEHSGYWIFGMLVDGLSHHRVDLLGPERGGTDALATADRIARERFGEQVTKARLAPSCIREASLEYQRSPRSAPVLINGHAAAGYELTLTVRVVSNLGIIYERARKLGVAPHDAAIEYRSTRAE